ncbi:MAG: hypothetical protein ABSB74_09720 [Tepidisphaeraceae bacterium]
MNRLLAWTAPVALAACVCGLLKADDAPPPVAGQGSSFSDADAHVWWVEHMAAVAKDPEASGVQAVFEARDLLKSKEPQVAIDFFTKAMYDTKSRAVQREIRLTLYQLYKGQGQTDKALDQLQQLIVGQE